MTDAAEAIPVGNYEAKYDARNPVSRVLVNGFLNAFDELTALADPVSIHEAGCGEGVLTGRLSKTRAERIKGTDISEHVFSNVQKTLDKARFQFEEKSIFDLTPETDSADLVICCEVLEHVDDPERALAALYGLRAKFYLLSVPREPLWRIMNMARLKYVGQFGNTPGHLNHWSQQGFLKFLSPRFQVNALRAPTPWTMVLCSPK